MAQKCEGPTRTFLSNAAIEPNLIVKITAAAAGMNPPTVGVADADDTVAADKVIGVTTTRATAANQPITVELLHAPGTRMMTASVAIASAGFAYAAAGGKVAATGTVKRGIAIGAAGADGDWIEVMPIQA